METSTFDLLPNLEVMICFKIDFSIKENVHLKLFLNQQKEYSLHQWTGNLSGVYKASHPIAVGIGDVWLLLPQKTVEVMP